MAKTKFYAIKKGKTTGIFNDWDECKQYVLGFPGADYKGFSTEEEALNYLNEDQLSNSNFNDSNSIYIYTNNEIESMVKSDLENGYTVIFTDGSYNDELKKYSFGVYIQTIENNELKEYEFFDSYSNEKYLITRNVAGEIFGVIKALEWSISNNKNKVKFYYDYEGIEKWAIGEWETKNDIACLYFDIFNKNKLFFDAIEFQKVKSHSNIKFNDKADRLAKNAFYENKKNVKCGSTYFSIDNFNNLIFKQLISSLNENNDIKIDVFENTNIRETLNLSFLKSKLKITYYKEKEKLLIQGKLSEIFIEILNIISNFESINYKEYYQGLNDITSRKNELDNEKFKNYPKNIILKINTSISLSKCNILDIDDWSCILYPIFVALEGYIKFLLNKLGIVLNNKKNEFDCFTKVNGKFILNRKKVKNNNSQFEKNIEECYNFYSKYRNSTFHYKLIGKNDMSITINTKDEAISILNECLNKFKSI